jgi:endoglycosylceramidase
MLDRLSTLLIALLLAACGSSPGGGTSVDEPPQLRREGRWLVDPQNRVVLLHGVNLVWKLDPFVPPETAEGFLDADARWLAENGFNSARIGTLWVGVSPHAPGEVRADYLAAWDRVVQRLATNRIWMLFDFHQDLLGPLYGGEGVPEWAVESVRGPLTDALGPPDFGFPFNYFTPQLSEAFDTLWAERGPVRDGFRDAWIAVARKWRGQPYSMGYDLLNEPWAGLDYPTCLIPLTGCPTHDAASLQPFFEHARRGIRTVDPDNLVWFQSQPLISTGAPTGFTAVPGDTQLGYSFHYYCPINTLANAAQLGVLTGALPFGPSDTCDGFGPRVFDQARAQADRMNGVELLTEFGATDQVDVLEQVMTLSEQRLVGWQYWAYKNWRDPTTESQTSGSQSLFLRDDDLSTVKLDKLRALSRTYPQATAGIPQALSFDPATGAFSYRYTPRLASAPTEIFVPLALHYPNGYTVTVSGARVVSPANTSPLLIENAAGASEVVITLTRR